MTGAHDAGPRSGMAQAVSADPFAVLGLDRDADLTDDDVRAAWRRIAAATHPDLADGGDPGRFAAAAAAYTELRTRYGRGEARAVLAEDRGEHGAGPGQDSGPPAGKLRAHAVRGWRNPVADADFGPSTLLGRRIGRVRVRRVRIGRVRIGRVRSARLACRVVAAAGVSALAFLVAGQGPAGPALAVGAATWLVLTARRDLGRPNPERWPGVGHGRQPGFWPVATGRDGSDDQADHDPT